MRWLTALGVLMASGCAPECQCDSSVAVALNEEEDRLLNSGRVMLTLCLDTSCIEFDHSSNARNADAIVTYHQVPPRLVFISPEIRGAGQRSVAMFISSGGRELMRQWRAVDFIALEKNGERCDPACTHATLP